MSNDKSVNDTELNAYLDNQLDETQRREIEHDLRDDDAARDKLRDYDEINRTLHQMYDPVLEETIPDRLVRTGARRSRIRALAASVLLFMFGGMFGWQLQLQLADNHAVPSATEINLVQPAMFAHSVYAVEVAHPVEIDASQHEHLNRWLSKRLKTTLNAPNLTDSGYQLIGGRLLPSTQDRMAAQYMYENATGNRITLYVRRGDWGASQPLNHEQKNGYSMFYWIDDDLGYALTSDLHSSQQQDLAREVYKQMSIDSVKI